MNGRRNLQAGIFGGQIGTEINGLDDSVSRDDRGEISEVLGPNTEAGQALLVAAIGFGVLYLTVGVGQRGLVARSGAVLQAVAMVAAAGFVGNYLIRTFVVRHPDAPLAMGLHWDS